MFGKIFHFGTNEKKSHLDYWSSVSHTEWGRMGNYHYFECPPFTVSKLYFGTCSLWLYYFYRENNLWFLSQINWKAKSPGFGSWLWSVGFLSLLNHLCPLCISSSAWLGAGSPPGHTQPSSGAQPAKGRTQKNSLLDSSCLRLAVNCQLMETFLIPRRSLSTVI